LPSAEPSPTASAPMSTELGAVSFISDPK
jgi:hypothetical protein